MSSRSIAKLLTELSELDAKYNEKMGWITDSLRQVHVVCESVMQKFVVDISECGTLTLGDGKGAIVDCQAGLLPAFMCSMPIQIKVCDLLEKSLVQLIELVKADLHA